MNIMSGQQEKYASKERVLTTLNNGIPDRVPINYAANPGIDGRVKQLLKIETDDRDAFRKTLGIDFAGVAAAYSGPVLHPDIPGLKVNPLTGIRTKWIEHGSGGYWGLLRLSVTDGRL